MLKCKACRTNKRFKWIRLPDPEENKKDFLVEIGRKLHLPGDNQLADLPTFFSEGYTHIETASGKILYPLPKNNRKEKRKGKPRRFEFRRSQTLGPCRPVAVEIARAERRRYALAA